MTINLQNTRGMPEGLKRCMENLSDEEATEWLYWLEGTAHPDEEMIRIINIVKQRLES